MPVGLSAIKTLGQMKGELKKDFFCALFMGAFLYLFTKIIKEEDEKMKKTKRIVLVLSLLMVIAALFSCSDGADVWNDATYKSDTTLGEGSKTVVCEIAVGDNSVKLTLKTNEENLGEALFELGLVNDASFFDTLNGMKADYAKDNSWWAFYVADEMASYGVSDAKISGGERFKFVYTK